MHICIVCTQTGVKYKKNIRFKPQLCKWRQVSVESEQNNQVVFEGCNHSNTFQRLHLSHSAINIKL